MNIDDFKHSHKCYYSSNKLSQITFEDRVSGIYNLSGTGVSLNVFINGFDNLNFYINNVEDEFTIEIVGSPMNLETVQFDDLLNMYSYLKLEKTLDQDNKHDLKISMHDDCFYDIEFSNKDYIKSVVKSLMLMHLFYMSKQIPIDRIDFNEIVEYLLSNKTVNILTLKDKIIVSNRKIGLLNRLLGLYGDNCLYVS
jgi:hypothetical protein